MGILNRTKEYAVAKTKKRSSSSLEIKNKKVIERALNSTVQNWEVFPHKNKQIPDNEVLIQDPDNKFYNLYSLLYKKVPRVYHAVNTSANFVVQAGYNYESDTPAKVKELTELDERMNLKLSLLTVVRQMKTYGNAYAEIVKSKGGEILRLNMIHPKTMYIGVSKDDPYEVLHYYQSIATFGKKKDYVVFKPDEIIHFKNNVMASEHFGTSDLRAALNSVAKKLNIEENLGETIEKLSSPYIFVGIGDSKSHGTKAQVDAVIEVMNDIRPGDSIVVGGPIKTEVVSPMAQGLKIEEFLHYFDDDLLSSLGMPGVLIQSSKGGNRGDSSVMMEAFDRGMRSIQLIIGESLRDKLFASYKPMIMVWGDMSTTDSLKQAQQLQLLILAGIPIKTSMKISGLGGWVTQAEVEGFVKPDETNDEKPTGMTSTGKDGNQSTKNSPTDQRAQGDQ